MRLARLVSNAPVLQGPGRSPLSLVQAGRRKCLCWEAGLLEVPVEGSVGEVGLSLGQ